MTSKHLPSRDRLFDVAMDPWIGAYPHDEALETFLQTVPPADRRPIREACTSLFEAALAHLEFCASAGPLDMDEFHKALWTHLLPRFPWMGEAAFRSLRRFSIWHAAREGYSS